MMFIHGDKERLEHSPGDVYASCTDCGANGPAFAIRRKHGPRGDVWASDAAERAWNGEARELLDAVRDAEARS